MSSKATEGQTPDIYGQLHPVETPELLEQSLIEFEQEVNKLLPKQKTCLLQAQQKCPELLTKEFQLFFLRAEVFNADLAALRYARYWEHRVARFGPIQAFKSLTKFGGQGGALNPAEDTASLRLGLIRLLPTRDPMGRAILFFDGSRMDKSKYTRESMVRILWHLVHLALEQDERVQRHGVVIIADPRGVSSLMQIDQTLLKQVIQSIKGCIPIRMAGAHVCYPPYFFTALLDFLKLFMAERMKKRVQAHAAKSAKDLLAKLEKYGLTKQVLPQSLGGDVVFQD